MQRPRDFVAGPCYNKPMKNTSPQLKSFLHAGAVFLYVLGIAILLSKGENIFGAEDTLYIPIFMILLFVVSATTVGGLVLGRPILMYWDGKKKEALKFLSMTVGWLALFAIIIIFIQILK